MMNTTCYRLVVCEKPSVARSIAAVLGAGRREDGFLSGGGYLVSWCFGHLAELSDADAYDEKYGKWRSEDLPILPESWQYTVARNKQNSHHFMHPVISSKFRTICCKYCITISIVIPFNCLHCSTKTTIITIQIHTKEFSIRSTCCFNLWLNSSCNFEISSLNTGFCSCFSCTEREGSIFILSC